MFQTCPPLQSFRRGRRVCAHVEAVGFPVQKFYKMVYADENTTFEPLPAMLRNARQAGLNL